MPYRVALEVKKLPTSAGDIRDAGSICGSGRSPGKGHDNPLQYSCLENPMKREAWWATDHGITKSQTGLKQQHAPTRCVFTLENRQNVLCSLLKDAESEFSCIVLNICILYANGLQRKTTSLDFLSSLMGTVKNIYTYMHTLVCMMAKEPISQFFIFFFQTCFLFGA